jgi:endogenous inhibitor of DNA gyrase (YacG/DUF329 family)
VKTKDCKHCGVSFEQPKSGRSPFCSAECRRLNKNERMRPINNAYHVRNSETRNAAGREWRVLNAKSVETEQRTCACGTVFGGKGRTVCCSPECQRKQKQARATESERKPEVKARKRAYAQTDERKAIAKATARRFYEANRDEVNARSKAWLAAHPDVARMKQASRRARKRVAAVTLTKDERARMRKIYAEARRNGWHVDHIKPLARGGAHHPDNLIAIPPAMNMQKHTQHWPDLHALQ